MFGNIYGNFNIRFLCLWSLMRKYQLVFYMILRIYFLMHNGLKQKKKLFLHPPEAWEAPLNNSQWNLYLAITYYFPVFLKPPLYCCKTIHYGLPIKCLLHLGHHEKAWNLIRHVKSLAGEHRLKKQENQIIYKEDLMVGCRYTTIARSIQKFSQHFTVLCLANKGHRKLIALTSFSVLLI